MDSLLDVVYRECPDARVETLTAGKNFVVGFHSRERNVWVALDYRPPSDSLEDVLASVANMLVFCEQCKSDPETPCQQRLRVVSERLRKFLGPKGYEEFLSRAPVRAGSRTYNSGSPA